MKYPFDCVTHMTKNKTFSVEPRFSRKTDDSPLKIFAPGLSRFVFTTINSGKVAKCNVPISALADMEQRTQYAFNKYMEYTCRPSAASDGKTSPAYTKKFFAGSLKGKTPADILAENGENGKTILNDQYKWLKANLDKFPKNKELMEAIMDAATLDVSGLKKDTTIAPPIVPILDIGCRPLQRKTRGDGKCFCYEIHITFDASRDYPVNIKINNYYAPVLKRNDGTLNVKLSEKDQSSEIIGDFSMTAGDWNDTLDIMRLCKDSFFKNNFGNHLKMAEKAEYDNIQANKLQANNNQTSGGYPENVTPVNSYENYTDMNQEADPGYSNQMSSEDAAYTQAFGSVGFDESNWQQRA